MKVKLAANAELDLLNKEELTNALDDHASQLTGGVSYDRKTLTFTSPGVVSFRFDVPIGLVWSVRMVSVQKASSDTVQLWLNSVNPLSFLDTIADDGSFGNARNYSRGAINVTSGNTLIIQAKAATGIAYAGISVEEVEVGNEWRL